MHDPNEAALEAVMAPIEAARALPNAFYTDAAQFAEERNRVFARHWACIGFAKDVAALAMAEDDESAAHVAQHGRAEFAGEGALGLVVHVLGSQGDLGSGHGPGHGLEIEAGRTDGQVRGHVEGAN